MNDQQAREFVEMLAAPEPTAPPPCPMCDAGHPLEARCHGRSNAVASTLLGPAGPVTAAGSYRGHLPPASTYLAA